MPNLRRAVLFVLCAMLFCHACLWGAGHAAVLTFGGLAALLVAGNEARIAEAV